MPLGPARTIHVTTREQLDAALESADRVVVDGDDALLSYAVARASGDPAHRIDIELAAPLCPAAAPMPPAPHFDAPLQDYAARPAPIPSGFENVFAPAPDLPARSPQADPPTRSRVWIILATSILVLAVGLGGFAFLKRDAGLHLAPPSPPPPSASVPTPGEDAPVTPKSAVPPAGKAGTPSADDLISALSAAGNQNHTRGLSVSKPSVPAPPSEPVTAPIGPKAVAPSAVTAEMVQAIAWPAVAIIAIVALAIIARQAIATGRNVEFSWKVTEKVSGRVVITKVKNPQARRGRAAPA